MKNARTLPNMSRWGHLGLLMATFKQREAAQSWDETDTLRRQPFNDPPRPRSTRYNFLVLGVSGWPMRKFSGFTSPCT